MALLSFCASNTVSSHVSWQVYTHRERSPPSLSQSLYTGISEAWIGFTLHFDKAAGRPQHMHVMLSCSFQGTTVLLQQRILHQSSDCIQLRTSIHHSSMTGRRTTFFRKPGLHPTRSEHLCQLNKQVPATDQKRLASSSVVGCIVAFWASTQKR